jgi:dihydrofolate reductase
MRKLIVSEFLSLDGVMQGPGSPDEDRSGGFEHGGWQIPFLDDVMMSAVGEGIAAAGAYLLGRRTYEIFAAYWPHQPAGTPFADTLNDLPKHVASTTLEEPLAWQNSTLIRGDVAGEVARLKDQPGGNLVVLGSGELVQTLIRHGLIDEFGLIVCPIVLGSGKRLFSDVSAPVGMTLTDSKPTTTGAVMLTYVPTTVATEAATTAAAVGVP